MNMLLNRSRRRPLTTNAILLLSLLVWPPNSGATSPVSLSKVTDQGTVDLVADARVTVLHDPDSRLQGRDILLNTNLAGRFQALAPAQSNVGYRTGTTWGRFRLLNDTAVDQQIWLVLSSPRAQWIDLYYRSSGGQLVSGQSGSALPLSRRALPVRENVFPLTVVASHQTQVVFGVRTGTSLSLNAALWEPSDYLIKSARDGRVRNLINGTNLALLVFGVLLLAITRDRLFLLFSAYVLFFSLYVIAINGQARILLWPEAGEWGSRAIVFFACLSLVFLIELLRVFLESRRPLPWPIRGFFRVEQLACAVIALAVFFLPYRFGGIGSTGVWLAFSAVVPPLAGYRWLQGQREARVVLLGWGVFFLFAVLFSLEIFGAIANFGAAVYLHFSMIGLALAMALALGDRLTVLRRERSEAQDRALRAERDNRKALEDKVAERTRKLEEARKEAEAANLRKTDFLAVANHELRTPLTTILGCLELMDREPAGGSNTRLIDSIRMAGIHLQALIDNVLDFTRLDGAPPRASPRPFNPAGVAEQAAGPFAALAETRALDFRTEVPEDVPWVEGDPDRLRQVLINLLSNAFKYTSTGRIALELNIRQNQDCDHVVLHWAVVDTGMGISESARDELFQPFKRHLAGARSAQQGVGLGLPISQAILQSMGSTLHLDSVPGQGSRFSFILRLPGVGPTSAQRTPLDKPPPLRILLVEDHETNREVIRRLLESDGHKVQTAVDAPSALARLQEAQQDNRLLDLVLLDIHLPGTDGFALAARISQTQEVEPLMVGLSASYTPQMEEQSRQAGMAGLCGKPLDRVKLYALLLTKWYAQDSSESRGKRTEQEYQIDWPYIAELQAVTGRDEIKALWQRYQQRSQAQQQWIVEQLDASEPTFEALADAFHQLANTTASMGLLSLRSRCLEMQALAEKADMASLKAAWWDYLDAWQQVGDEWAKRMNQEQEQ